MSFHIQVAPPEHYEWLVERTSCHRTTEFRAIEAIDERDGRIVGMVGYDLWTANSAQMHVAVDTPAVVRAIVGPAFQHLFGRCKKGVAIGVVPSHNVRALRFDKHLGFTETYRIRDGWAQGDDLVILEMRRENCRWLKQPATGVENNG